MENPKKLYSKKRIEETFLLLLRKKPIERISVTELCEKAGINRSTFYAHYIDIYDLMEKVTDSFVRHLFHDITGKLSAPTGKSYKDTYSMVLRSLEVTLQNRELCGLLIRSRTNLSERLISEAMIWKPEGEANL